MVEPAHSDALEGTAAHNGAAQPTAQHGTQILTTLGLCALVAVGILALDIRFAPEKPEGPLKLLHELSRGLAEALIVASIVGITYEYVLWRRRQKDIEALLRSVTDEQTLALNKSLDAYATLHPNDIFDLLKSIATQTSQTPTLYEPPRSPSEYTFASSIDYFDRLLGARRSEISRLLSDWLGPGNHPNVRFLASDFVGRYRLVDLAPFLQKEAANNLVRWEALTSTDKGWTLNYLWAASSCEEPHFTSLGRLLSTTKYDDITEWILFVPQQIPDPDFIAHIDTFLRRHPRLTPKRLVMVFQALAAIEASHPGATRPLISNHMHLLSTDDTRQAFIDAWASRTLDAVRMLEDLGKTDR